MIKILSLRRYNEEREAVRAAFAVALHVLGKAQVQMDQRHANVLAKGFNLVKKPEDPALEFAEPKRTEAQRIMRIR